MPSDTAGVVLVEPTAGRTDAEGFDHAVPVPVGRRLNFLEGLAHVGAYSGRDVRRTED
jgi:hypothetical protein